MCVLRLVFVSSVNLSFALFAPAFWQDTHLLLFVSGSHLECVSPLPSGTMSKSPALQKNSILNYFKRTPAKEDTTNDDKETFKTPLKAVNNSSTPKAKVVAKSVDKPSNKTPSKRKKNLVIGGDDGEDSSLENEISFSKSAQKKRFKRVLVDSSDDDSETSDRKAKPSDDEDEYKPDDDDDDVSSDEVISDAASEDHIETPSDDDYDDIEYENKKRPAKVAKQSKSTTSKKQKNNTTFTNTTLNNTTITAAAVTHIEAADREWPHLNYEFLQPENIQDANRQKMLTKDGELNPNYDPATLYVPKDFLDKQTPAHRQWWQFKAANFDTVLFFKMGKFYELFHMDAVIATKELQILFMKGESAHAGFPEKSYKRYADVLIQKGYKVARIEQTETPQMMQERTKGTRATKFDKVVKREICRISSLGTRYMSDIDSDALGTSNSYLFAFTAAGDDLSEFGIAFVDVSIGRIHLAQFKDDGHNSKLRTLLAHYSPSEIVYAGSNNLVKLLDRIFPSVRKQNLKRFLSSSETLKYLSEQEIWKNVSNEFRNQILDRSDVLERTCVPEYELAVSSLGGIIKYLEKSLIAYEILSMGQFELYIPPECNSSVTKLPDHLILDSITIKNLEVLQNLRGEESSSLFKIIDNCATPFGKRLLRNWLCWPLCNQREELEQRQDAVREFGENDQLTPQIGRWCSTMKSLPDLERLLTQIHAQGSLKRARDHPDSRAILFEDHIYRKRRIDNFLNTLEGFESIVALVEDIASRSTSTKSKLLSKLVNLSSTDGSGGGGGVFPDLSPKISYFREAFDAQLAREKGSIVPNKGADVEYDAAIDDIENVEKSLNQYLKKQQEFFNSSKVKFIHKGKDRYLLEVPELCCQKAVKSTQEEYVEKSKCKGFKRYHTATITNLVAQLERAEEKRSTALVDIFRRFLEKFDQDYAMWSKAISCVATLDALISLSKTKQIFEANDSSSCLPQFVWPCDGGDGPMLYAEDLRNACLIESRSLIANNVELNNGTTMVLTGPNMAGKTTLMRSIGLMVILAQIGAYVPASSCRLSPVDRIFTRIGAYDQVIESQSTFMVELSETVSIVRYATQNSLVLVDELGRGTSTFDGIAIAQSVLEEISDTIKCRCIFSTHFHSIVDELQNSPSIKVAHMAYMLENVNKEDPTETDIIFLYKLTDGVCSQSYGYNVAKLAGIPSDILRDSYKAGHAFELQVESCRLLDTFAQNQKDPFKPSLSEEKIDQLAQFLAEIIITRKSNVDITCI